ncbi:MAG: imidazole glycerol phosphate synthase subunit HisH [Actinomycetota bacterium]
MTSIAVLDYDSGNLHSVARALERVGADVRVTDDGGEAARTDAVLVPGVGHFGACKRSLAMRGLDVVVRDAVASGRPVFGVCVGLQVFLNGSEEDTEEGIGVLEGTSRLLTGEIKVPHMGWNEVAWTAAHPYTAQLPSGTRFYFVHSYAPDVDTPGTIGTTEHGRVFASVLARDNVFATQFHPEKSGEAGLQLYETFVKEAGSR